MMMVGSSLLLLPSSSSSSILPHLISSTNYRPLSPSFPIPREKAQAIVRKTSKRGISVVTRAGPSGSSYIFAFVFPLSLLAVTIVTSIRIAQKLDQKFYEELAMEQAILEAQDEDQDEDEDNEIPISPSTRETTRVRSRNRPKREVEPSSSSK